MMDLSSKTQALLDVEKTQLIIELKNYVGPDNYQFSQNQMSVWSNSLFNDISQLVGDSSILDQELSDLFKKTNGKIVYEIGTIAFAASANATRVNFSIPSSDLPITGSDLNASAQNLAYEYVNVLSHEVGHFEDSQGQLPLSYSNNISLGKNPYFDANFQAITPIPIKLTWELLSEGRAEFNNSKVYSQIISRDSSFPDPVYGPQPSSDYSFPNGLPITTKSLYGEVMLSGNVITAEPTLAAVTALGLSSDPSGYYITYLQKYGAGLTLFGLSIDLKLTDKVAITTYTDGNPESLTLYQASSESNKQAGEIPATSTSIDPALSEDVEPSSGPDFVFTVNQVDGTSIIQDFAPDDDLYGSPETSVTDLYSGQNGNGVLEESYAIAQSNGTQTIIYFNNAMGETPPVPAALPSIASQTPPVSSVIYDYGQYSGPVYIYAAGSGEIKRGSAFDQLTGVTNVIGNGANTILVETGRAIQVPALDPLSNAIQYSFNGQTVQFSSIGVIQGSVSDTFFNVESTSFNIYGVGTDNTVRYADFSTGVIVNLLTGVGAGGALLYDIQNVTGSTKNDIIFGSRTAGGTIDGNGGEDLLYNEGQNTTFYVHSGTTIYQADATSSFYYGGYQLTGGTENDNGDIFDSEGNQYLFDETNGSVTIDLVGGGSATIYGNLQFNAARPDDSDPNNDDYYAIGGIRGNPNSDNNPQSSNYHPPAPAGPQTGPLEGSGSGVINVTFNAGASTATFGVTPAVLVFNPVRVANTTVQQFKVGVSTESYSTVDGSTPSAYLSVPLNNGFPFAFAESYDYTPYIVEYGSVSGNYRNISVGIVVNTTLPENNTVTNPDGSQTTTTTEVSESRTVDASVSGKIYQSAVAYVPFPTVDLGALHVGDAVSGSFAIANTASGSLTDTLNVISTTNPYGGIVSLSSVTGIAAGALGNVNFTFSSKSSGQYVSPIHFAYWSHDADLQDVGASNNTDSAVVEASVYNYAAPVLSSLGSGTFTSIGNQYFLNLGTVAPGFEFLTDYISVSNNATGLADLLGGTFSISGDPGFTNTGFGSLSNIAEGQSSNFAEIDFLPVQVGTFEETITFSPTSSNVSGYSGALVDQTLTVVVNVGSTLGTNFTYSGGVHWAQGNSSFNTVLLRADVDSTPDQNWTISKKITGDIVIEGGNSGYVGSTTLTNIQQVGFGYYNTLYDLLSPSGPDENLNITTPTDGAVGNLVVDGLGNNQLTFNSARTSYWHTGAGDTFADLQAGSTEIYMQGPESNYAVSFDGISTLTVVDSTGANGVKTIDIDGGTGELVFSDGGLISLNAGGAQYNTIYGGAGNDTFMLGYSNGPVFVDGGGGINQADLLVQSYTPGNDWSITENAKGQAVISNAQFNNAAPVTLANFQVLDFYYFYYSYDLVMTPVGGGAATISTPTDVNAGTIVVDAAGNDTLTFDSTRTSYWHTGAGDTFADLQAGSTEIYMQGPESNYAVSFDGISTLTVVDSTGANGVKTIDIDGGTGELVFSDGGLISLNAGGAQYNTIYGGAGNDTFMLGYSNGPVFVDGGGGINQADLLVQSYTPGNDWSITENAKGQAVISNAQFNNAAPVTLANFQVLDFYYFYYSYDLVMTPVGGGAATISTPTDVNAGTIVVDAAGNDTLTFDSTRTSYWHTGAGDTFADLQAGSTEIYMQGPESNYAVSFDGISTLTVVDSTGANGVKTIDIDGGTGELVFSDGGLISLNAGGAQYNTIYGGAGNDTFMLGYSNGPVFVDGGGGVNQADLLVQSYTPGNDWSITENAQGQAVISNAQFNNAAPVTLANFQVLDFYYFYYSYDLVMTPVGGGAATISTPTDVNAGTIVVDAAGNDTLTFDSTRTSYWHTGAGDTFADLQAGSTEIYMQGPESNYAVSFDGISTLTVVDSTGANGVKTIDIDGGTGELVFSDGGLISLNAGGAQYNTIYGGAGNDTFMLGYSNGPVFVDGGGGVNQADLLVQSYTPGNDWSITENAQGQAVISNAQFNNAAPVTLANFQVLDFYYFYYSYDLVMTPVGGGAATISTPTDVNAGTIVVDAAGNDTLTFNSTRTSYWHTGAGDTFADLQTGSTEIYMQGSESNYAVSFDSISTLTVVDTTGANGVKTIDIDGGTGELVFSDGGLISLNAGGAQYNTIYGGAGNDTFTLGYSNGPVFVDGGGGINQADLLVQSYTPGNDWSITENAKGQAVISNAQFNNAAPVTLANFQVLDFYYFYYSYDLVMTPVGGGAATISTPTDVNAGTIVVDAAGNDTLTFDSTRTSYWHTGAGDTFADLQAGSTEIYMQGPESNYAVSFDGISTLTVVDSTGANGVKTIDIDGGTGELVFSDGGLISLNAGGAQYNTIYGGAGNDTFMLGYSNGPVFVDGGGGVNQADLLVQSYTPGNDWSITENAQGQAVISNAQFNNAAPVTLANFQVLDFYYFYYSYDLVMTPVGGGAATISTPTDVNAGTIVVDAAGNDALTFDSTRTSYWHTGGGTDTASLVSGNTEIYLAGAEGDYTLLYNGIDTVTVANVGNIDGTGTKTITLKGGTGELVFGDNNKTSLSALPATNNNWTDSLVLGISEDAYDGDAQFTISVDDTQIGGVQTATAIRSMGQDQTFTVDGNFGSGIHTVSVDFLNDAYGGSASTDRNLYVDSVSYDGSASQDSLALFQDGSQSLQVQKVSTAGTSLGSGADSLVLGVLEDEYDGNAQFTISVDGTQIGGVLTATAIRSMGQDQTFTVNGNFGSGVHTLSVDFLNDAYGGSWSTDRNLYIDNVSYDDSASQGSLALYSGGSQSLQVQAPTQSTVTGTPANDTLAAYSVPTMLVGNGGDDTYVIGAKTTTQTIVNGASVNNVAAGTIDFVDPSLTDNTLWFAQSGNNLVIDVLGTQRQTVAQNWFAGGDTFAQTSEIVDSNGLKLDSALQNLVQAMASFSASNPAFNPQSAGATMPVDATLQNTIATAWHS